MTVSGQTNACGNLFAPVARTATAESARQENPDACGLVLTVVASTIAGGETVTPQIQGWDPATDSYVTIHSAITAINAAGNTVYALYPSATAPATQAKNMVLPRYWRLRMAHSASGSHTYSASYSYVK